MLDKIIGFTCGGSLPPDLRGGDVYLEVNTLGDAKKF
jgi:hypothetical protein